MPGFDCQRRDQELPADPGLLQEVLLLHEDLHDHPQGQPGGPEAHALPNTVKVQTGSVHSWTPPHAFRLQLAGTLHRPRGEIPATPSSPSWTLEGRF